MHQDLKQELLQLKKELYVMVSLTQKDYGQLEMAEKRYHTGIIVGIGYAILELNQLMERLSIIKSGE